MNSNDKKKVWSLRFTPGNSEADVTIEELCKELNVSTVTAKLLYNRGYRTVRDACSFLCPAPDVLHDPYDLADMDRAVARISRALEDGERITVYGDYDVDGVTSVTLIYTYLKALGADIDYYIPIRSKEGYGLSTSAIDNLYQRGTRLIITVDTGITAVKEAKYAESLGIDMVITDHHECHANLPDACAVVNPHRKDCPYPFKELAGVGVVFKIVCAYEIFRRPDLDAGQCVENVCREYIDLVAIGTVADVMPLADENREIVRRGLLSIEQTDRCGLAALIEATNIPANRPAVGDKYPPKKRKINSGYISFALAPRINAAGRISTAEKAVELLLEKRADRAVAMAEELCEINLRRQQEENRIAECAYRMIEEQCDLEHDRVIVLDSDNWQQGIIGIVSSRITEKYGLPSILISFDGATRGYSSPDDIGKGSGRSVKGMNLVDALDHCKDLLVQFGGHELAAGLSVMRCNIDEFRKQINEYARDRLSNDIFNCAVEADCEIDPAELSMALVEEIKRLEPFGVANSTPLFMIKELTLDKVIPMSAGKHSKLLLSVDQMSFQAVCFGMSATEMDFYPGEKVDLLCQIGINEFRGQTSLQLIVQDIRLSERLVSTYEAERKRYIEIVNGAAFEERENIMPTRSQIADVYKFLKYENMCGHSLFSYRTLRSSLIGQVGVDINYPKLRFIVRILQDINVCELEEQGDNYFFLEVIKNASKTNIELSEIYRQLAAQYTAN